MEANIGVAIEDGIDLKGKSMNEIIDTYLDNMISNHAKISNNSISYKDALLDHMITFEDILKEKQQNEGNTLKYTPISGLIEFLALESRYLDQLKILKTAIDYIISSLPLNEEEIRAYIEEHKKKIQYKNCEEL